MKCLFIIILGWIVIISAGLFAGLIFNKTILDKKILQIFNIALATILLGVTVYFFLAMKNLF